MKNMAVFLALCKQAGIPAPTLEHKFHHTRKWRFDVAWIEHRVALEVEGGAFVGGRHTRGAGFVRDMEKYNAATVLGWRMLRCTPQQLCKTEMIETIKAALNNGDRPRGK